MTSPSGKTMRKPTQGRGRPPSAQSSRDRARTLKLVKLTGRARLNFTVSDVRRTMSREPRLQLENAKVLSNHVAALEDDVIRRVGQGDLIPGREALPGRAKRFVLIERMPEFRAGYRSLSDAEKMSTALHLALFASRGEAVPTVAVTAVIRTIPELTPEADAPTYSFLQRLETRLPPLAHKVQGDAGGSSRWQPIGDPPEHPSFGEWQKLAGEIEGFQTGLFDLGAGTLTDITTELVSMTVASYGESWPSGGRPVIADEIHEVAATSEDAGHHLQIIEDRGQTLGGMLGEVTKTTINGVPRQKALVIKVENPWDGTTYYDVPGGPDPDLRSKYVTYKGALESTRPNERDKFREELRLAKRLLSGGDRMRVAIGAARILLARRRWYALEETLAELEAVGGTLPKKALEKVSRRLSEMRRMRRTIDVLDEPVEDRFVEALTRADLDPQQVLSVPRPLLLAEELAEFAPRGLRQDRTPAQLLGHIVGLTRYPNPGYVGPHGRTPQERNPKGVDRVAALSYMGSRVGSPMDPLVGKVERLLGPALRSPVVFEKLLQTGDEEDERLGLVGLALLGEDVVVRRRALRILGQSTVSERAAQGAVWALMLTRQLKLEILPDWLHRCQRSDLLNLARPALRKAEAGRWLLRG